MQALFGFDVTSLDISAVPAEWFGRALAHPDCPLREIEGFRIAEDGAATFGNAAAAVDPALCPGIHRKANSIARGGGILRFATGDVLDELVCPGPFDAIIERRTLQLLALPHPYAASCP